jgi:asparagine synthetase A
MKLIQKITLLSLCFAFVHSIAASDLIVGGITNVDTPLITNVDTPLTSLNLRISGRAVTFEIQPNTIYLIEVSEDLMKWSEHATLEVGDQKGGGTFTITDDSMDLPSTKFYRVKWWTNRS